jgi:hypothetical protein
VRVSNSHSSSLSKRLSGRRGDSSGFARSRQGSVGEVNLAAASEGASSGEVLLPSGIVRIRFAFHLDVLRTRIRSGCRSSQTPSYGSTDILQEGLNILPGRLGEQSSVGIPAHVLTEEVKARCPRA